MKLKHYLIASPENDYQPWILSKTALACFVLSVWTLRLFMPGYIAVGAPGLDNQDLMNRINAERTNRFIPALISNSKLSTAASIKSNDMINRDYFAHVNPDGDYVWPVIEAQGYKPYQALGENLAVDFNSAEGVVNAWMNSPGHRANILNEKFEDQGMAAVFGNFENHDTYLITNLFGTLIKKASPPPPAPTPAPTPAPVPAPTPTPKPTPPPAAKPTPTPTPVPAPVPTPTPAAIEPPPPTPTPVTNEPTELPNTIPATTDSTKNNDTTPGGMTESTSGGLDEEERAGLASLKILLGVFAGLYTLFLGIDSIIIHRARVRRENMSSSPHALMMVMIAMVNFFTLWI